MKTRNLIIKFCNLVLKLVVIMLIIGLLYLMNETALRDESRLEKIRAECKKSPSSCRINSSGIDATLFPAKGGLPGSNGLYWW